MDSVVVDVITYSPVVLELGWTAVQQLQLLFIFSKRKRKYQQILCSGFTVYYRPEGLVGIIWRGLTSA